MYLSDFKQNEFCPFPLCPIPFPILSVSAPYRIDEKCKLCRIPLCLLPSIVPFRQPQGKLSVHTYMATLSRLVCRILTVHNSCGKPQQLQVRTFKSCSFARVVFTLQPICPLARLPDRHNSTECFVSPKTLQIKSKPFNVRSHLSSSWHHSLRTYGTPCT
jgi:hypothetical protein